MKKIVFNLILVIALLVIPTSCSNGDSIRIGYTPFNGPITLFLDSDGIPKIEFNGRFDFPIIGTIEVSYSPEQLNHIISNYENISPNTHNTYVRLLNKHDNEWIIISLTDIGETVEWECSNSIIKLENQKYCTLVTVESDEISNLLHKKRGPGFKPDFPETPLSYFCLTKCLLSRVNWGISSIADFFADVFFGFIFLFAAMLDLCIIMILFVFRFIWWGLILIGYLIGI